MDFRFYIFNVQQLLLLSIFPCCCFCRDFIEQDVPLMDNGETLVSAGEGTFELGFFSPIGSLSGNRYVGIWYRSSPQTVVWVANRDSPGPSSGLGVFGISDSNLHVWDDNESLWSSGIETLQDVLTAKLMDSGNLVLGNFLWESFENPTDTFLPGMKMRAGLNLTSWKAKDDPSLGRYIFKLDDQQRCVIMNKSVTYWRSEDKRALPNILNNRPVNSNIQTNRSVNFNIQTNRSVNFNFTAIGRDYNDTRLVMKFDGTIEYQNTSMGFVSIWFEPANRCSVVEACGVFGVCNAQGKEKCKCLPGFKQVYRDFSGGCQRKESETEAECGKAFLNFTLMKVKNPESEESQISNETKCMESCLESCKCNAYSFRAGTHRSSNTCLIWDEPLSDLQGNFTGGFNLSVRQVSEDPESMKKKNCKSCGTVVIPYPLSTEPDCGDPMYFSFRCNSADESVAFKALDGDYKVVSFDRNTRRFKVQVDDTSHNCESKGFRSKVLQLNQSLPFIVTNWFKGSSFQGASPKACEVEIQWNPEPEPVCTSDSDCDELPNTSCGPAKGDGRNRCLCKTAYKWNSVSLDCIHSQGSSFPLVIVLASISALALLCASTWLIIWKRKRLRKRGKKRSEQRSKELLKLDTQERIKHCMNPGEFDEEDGKGVDVPFINFDAIITATDGFSDYNKLGQGGYGPVYKGTFQGGQELAVKRLSSVSVQGLEEFKNEVIVIAKLQHRNLVRLQGYCIKGSEKILLYEYMPNRSLDSFIFDEEQSKMLDWEKRFNIIVGIARGLLYLHQDSRLRIIHRDLKTSNILLDQEMEPKISDFGLARIFGSKQTEANTERVVGTYGYMSPEYAIEGLFSVKSDVYSFGVVLLEIISGKRNTRLAQLSGRPLSLLGYAWQLWTENKVLGLVDPTMTESCNSEQFMKCVKIALICVQEDPSERPTMSTVVTMLDSNSADVPDPLQPAFVLKTGTTIASSSSADTRAEITVTLEHGR